MNEGGFDETSMPVDATRVARETPLVIEAERLSVRYRAKNLRDSVDALHDVSFHMSAGTFAIVLGPSGSGKSTLLHAVGGLLKPTSGRLRVATRDLMPLSPRELAIYRHDTVGFVFQGHYLLPHLSAYENVTLPLIAQKVGQKLRRSLAMDALTRVGIQHRSRHLPAQLSGGEQQRVALARAIVHMPRLIIADEPTGNLDEQNALIVRGVLEGLANHGLSVLCATHDMNFTKNADLTIRLSYGKLVPSSSDQEANHRGE